MNLAYRAKSVKIVTVVPWTNTNDLSGSPSKNIQFSWNYDVISCQSREILKCPKYHIKYINMGLIRKEISKVIELTHIRPQKFYFREI